MNFEHMPELPELWGYPVALALMARRWWSSSTASSAASSGSERAARALYAPAHGDRRPRAAGAGAGGAGLLPPLRDARRAGAARPGVAPALLRRVRAARLIAADLPPLATVAEELVVAHMAQHLLIADLAALLFCLGLTGPVLQPILAVRWLGWLRALRQPAGRLPRLGSQPLRVASRLPLRGRPRQRRCFTLPSTARSSASGWRCGCRWWARCPRRPGSATCAKLGYVIAVRFAGAVLANVLIWSGDGALPGLRGRARRSRASAPLADQGAAGNLMMIETGAVTLGLFTWLFFRAANRGVEKQELLDLADRPRRPARRGSGGSGRRRGPGRGAARADPAATASRGATGHVRQPVPLRAGLRGRHGQPRRRDRGRAADGAVLRRLHDRLGEHDRRGAGRALDRLLAGRPARATATRTSGACA